MQTQTDLQVVKRKEGTVARIMSWNILSEELSPGVPSIADRIDGVCETLLQYLPDAVGIQEISESAYGMFDERIGDIYEFVNPKTKEGSFSFTTVAYNKQKYRLINSDIVNYSLGNRRIRVMDWILLEEISAGVRFILLSTHWDVHAKNRCPQAEEMGRLVKELEQTYGAPVICTGDFNAKDSSNAYRLFIETSEHDDAKLTAPGPLNTRFTCHPVGSFTPYEQTDESIDHITVTKGVTVLHHEIVTDGDVVNRSDHYPLYVDLEF
ncbi:MAG: endonuclease/exonuclease/phosphatase family protein [Clostridia bacterium]|nr:endonuclease/exonuclease/phosphatase family protein [Clostridia bacterium]